jgi:hypothetical protein
VGSCKGPDVNSPISGYVGGHGGDESRRANRFFSAEMALVFGDFSRPSLLYDAVQLRRTKAPIPVRSFHGFFYFREAFAGSGEIGDEIAYPRHTWAGGGGDSARLSPDRPSGRQLIFRIKPVKGHLLITTAASFFI